MLPPAQGFCARSGVWFERCICFCARASSRALQPPCSLPDQVATRKQSRESYSSPRDAAVLGAAEAARAIRGRRKRRQLVRHRQRRPHDGRALQHGVCLVRHAITAPRPCARAPRCGAAPLLAALARCACLAALSAKTALLLPVFVALCVERRRRPSRRPRVCAAFNGRRRRTFTRHRRRHAPPPPFFFGAAAFFAALAGAAADAPGLCVGGCGWVMRAMQRCENQRRARAHTPDCSIGANTHTSKQNRTTSKAGLTRRSAARRRPPPTRRSRTPPRRAAWRGRRSGRQR